jgi:molecular chaperone DnaK
VVRLIPNQEGAERTPCVIALTEEGEWLVGEPARRQAATASDRTVTSLKRSPGCRADEERLHREAEQERLIRGRFGPRPRV